MEAESGQAADLRRPGREHPARQSVTIAHSPLSRRLEQELPIETFIHLITTHTLLAMYCLLAMTGTLLPVPEEVLLVIGGYAVHLGHAHWLWVCLAAALGVLTGDSLIFLAGRLAGERLFRVWPFRLMAHNVHKAEAFFAKHGNKTLFFGRFMFGLRGASFFAAGNLKVRYRTMVLMDLLGIMITVPVSIWLGYMAGDRIEVGLANARQFAHITGAIMAGVALLIIALKVRRWRKDQREAAEAEASRVSEPLETSVDPAPH